MKLVLQLSLIPADSNHDKARWAKDHGAEGIELFVGQPDVLHRTVDDLGGLLPVTTVCGNCSKDSGWSFDFLNPDKAKRDASIEGSKKTLAFCGEVGAVGQVIPPIFGGPMVPDLSPFMNQMDVQEALWVAELKELGPYAAAHGTKLLVEPLNRYEQHYLRKQEHGIRVIKKANVKGLGMLSDFFHMHIEEEDTPAALRAAGKYVTHVHLADNTRMEPGTGDIDFVAGFKALKGIGFKGYMAYECAISGATQKDKQKNLAKSLDYMRACIAKAR